MGMLKCCVHLEMGENIKKWILKNNRNLTATNQSKSSISKYILPPTRQTLSCHLLKFLQEVSATPKKVTPFLNKIMRLTAGPKLQLIWLSEIILYTIIQYLF